MSTARHHAQSRYTCKAYDANQKISEVDLNELLEILRLAPSSINSQPWQFLVTDNADTKAKITQSMVGGDAHNAAKINNASHVIIMCTRTDLGDAHLQKVLQAEKDGGRFASDEVMQARFELCNHYISQLADDQTKLFQWSENQTFIALGHLLFAVSLMGIDATPIGGYDQAVLDEAFGLADQGLKSSVLVALGYASQNDGNKNLPKARLNAEEVIKFT